MKKLIFVISLVVIIFSVHIPKIYSQWIQQYTGTSAILRDIEFLNENTGWAVGDGGTCLKTTNGGTNWLQQNNPAGTKPFVSVHIVDSNVVYLVGYFETIIKTTNGGTNWLAIKNGPYGGGNSYYGVYFLNKDTGWVGGVAVSNYNLLHTTNGFISFDTSQIPNEIHDICFVNKDTGFISCEGQVFRTTNSGSSWDYCMQLSHFYIFNKISFLKNGYGWVVGSTGGGMFRTTNYGENWNNISNSFISGMSGIYFINKDTGFVGGGLSYTYKTTNGGFNWFRENTNIYPNQIESIEFVNDTTGWICATGGVILKTTTQGESITNIEEPRIRNANNYYLLQNYPNPFNSQTKISFSIPKSGFVNISIYDIPGKKIDEIVNKNFNEGSYEINYSADRLSSGIYIYTLNVNGITLKTSKFILIK